MSAGQITEVAPGIPDDSFELQPFYYDARNKIVRPKQVVVGTRYFWEKWAPRLGPTLTVLVVRLRMHCYYNQRTSERRDWCFPTQETLAGEAGISRWTVMRELKKPLAKRFVRVQYRSRYDAERRQTVRVSSLYEVAMDDPLVDEDHGKLRVLVAQELLQRADDQHDSHCGIREPGRDVAERPITGSEAHLLLKAASPAPRTPMPDAMSHPAPDAVPTGSRQVQPATGPGGSNLPPEDVLEQETPVADADIARELIAENVSPTVADKLARDYPAERIREKVALVRQLKEQRANLRNVPGFLRRAIEDDYALPLRATGTDNPRPLLRLKPAAPTMRNAECGMRNAAGRQTADHATAADHATRSSARGQAEVGQGVCGSDVWEQAKERLRSEMPPAAFDQWLSVTRLLHYEPGRAVVLAPDARVQRYLQLRLAPAIDSALSTACAGPTQLDIILEEKTS
ncbi:MAG: DnaA N-terminal domain-containing protein [Chloroflexota bacterium]